MVGFVCYASGRVDPTQFFYNMTVIFDSPPDLHTLSRAIEQQATEDGACGDGSEFIVSDLEILDFRLNLWVNLEREIDRTKEKKKTGVLCRKPEK